MTTGPDVYQYTDYRAYLRDWYEHAKQVQPQVSYRFLARKTGVDAGYLAHTFQGSKHLTPKATSRFAEVIKLDERASRYLLAMLDFAKAKQESDIKEKFQKLMDLREVDAKVLSQKQYRYWMHWYIPAIRLSLMSFAFSGDYAALARRITPSITPKQAEEAIHLLEELQLIRQRPEDGIYEALDLHISTGDKWASQAIREFQSKTLELAQTSLRNHPAHLREIATLTLAIPQEEIATLQDMMREFRAKVAKWAVGLGDSDCVVQLDLASFPMSLPEGALK